MSLEEIYDLKPDESQLLFSSDNPAEIIEVREWQQFRWLHLGDRSVQAVMQTNEPEQIMLPNIQAMLVALLFNPEPERLLNLGLGGASLERYLCAQWPELKVTSVESNKKIIELAEQYFYLPDEIEVKHELADRFIKSCSESYDIALCDIFVADNQASCLYDKNFYENMSKCINANGILAINILPESEEDVVNVLLPIKDYFDYLYLLEFPDFSNAVIFASRQKIPGVDVLCKRAEELNKNTLLDLTALPENIHVLLETV